MKIDEARNRVVDKFCNLRNAYVDHLAYDGKGDTETEALIHALDEVITALDWYIDQDLVKREDVKLIYKFIYDKNLRETLNEALDCVPKAEPKKKETLNEIRAKYGLAPIPHWEPPEEER